MDDTKHGELELEIHGVTSRLFYDYFTPFFRDYHVRRVTANVATHISMCKFYCDVVSPCTLHTRNAFARPITTSQPQAFVRRALSSQ